jgi:hypothetical protein
MANSRYSPDEIARRGDEIYDRIIRSNVEGTHDGQAVAIDIDTESFVINDDAGAAAEELLTKNSDAEIWVVRIGKHAMTRIGYCGDAAEK